MVEILRGERQSLQVSCLYRVTEGFIVKTDTERVLKARKIICEIFFAYSPHSETVNIMALKYGFI